MTNKTKGRPKATPKHICNSNRSALRAGIKAVIVGLAVWRVISPAFASWLLQRGGLNDA